ncbi:hypothetical protein [Dactylosporangium sp. CA-233914]|uniref:hypothetical protein n=1 Tax=Dactylosporangium sp. CA-233914 TaxID=3239934 RepID=UPI003D8C6686
MLSETDASTWRPDCCRSFAPNCRALDRIGRCLRGEHDGPYLPRAASTEYKLLARRREPNVLPLVAHRHGLSSLAGTHVARSLLARTSFVGKGHLASVRG